MAMQPRASLPTATGGHGTAEVDRLLSELERNLEDARLSLKQQGDLLGRVKVYGRDPKTAGPIFERKSIEVLSRYGFDSGSSDTSREALRCLANAFLLNEPCRQTFVDLNFAPKAAERLKLDSFDDEFLISRILFLMTYNTKLDFENLVEHQGLADSINEGVQRHAKAFSNSERGKTQIPPMEHAAMIETLKLMFNITYYYSGLIPKFTPAIEPLVSLLMHHPLPALPLQPPITYMLNALLNLDLDPNANEKKTRGEARSSPLFPYSAPEQVMNRLITILDNALKSHPERELDQAAAPLCTLIRKVYELASPQLKSWMRRILLPQEEDRDKPLGQGDTLSSRLLRASCSAGLPTLRENISSLLFELSDKDANNFVKNIGYGFASGFLMSHNIAIPANAAEANSTASDGDADINPVTGQRLSAEEQVGSGSAEMSEEEKEQEAERLFVLFERLRATGVMDVQNPVRQAVEEGRFEELPD